MDIDVNDILPVLNIEDLDEEVQDVLDQETDDTVIQEEKEDKVIEKSPEPVIEDSGDNKVSTMFYQELAKRGIAIESDKDEHSWEDVESTLNNYTEELPKRVADTLIDSVPEVGKSLMSFLFAKQDSLTKENLQEYFNEHLNNLNTPSEFTDDQARSYLQDHYKGKFRASQITAMIDALEDEDALQDEAKKLVDQSKQKREAELVEERERRNQNQAQFVQSLNSEFKDLSWSKQRVSKVKDIITSGDGNRILGEVVNDPKGLIQMMNFLTYWKDGSFDLSDFSNIQKSKRSRSLKDSITEEMMSSATNNTKSKNKNRSGFDIGKFTPML